jgi:alanyl-tRNA synthetase
MRHGYLLGAREPLLARLLPLLIERMGAAYPELGRAQTLLTTTFDLEERRFQQTLEQGLTLLSRKLSLLPAGQPLAGSVAFKLYDTFGFPLDVTEDILREQGLALDLKGFEEAMAQQRIAARAAWSGSGERALDSVYLELQEQLGETRFLGYTQEDGQGEVQVLLQEGERISSLKLGESALLIVNQTPFYGESGGQMGDTGFWETSSGACGIVQETQKKAGMILHKILVERGVLEVGQEILLRVDAKRRQSLRFHHSATHLLHQALRQLLGTHVTQRGSLVAPEKLRFDFSHPHRLEPKILREIESLVNAQIRSNWPVTTRLMTPEAATKEGALALFGEKYGEEVRVVTMGEEGFENAPFSVELCGGTHVERTGDLGFFKILSESGIAAGIRRLEAVAGEAALEEVQSMSHTLDEAAEFLKTAPSQVPEKLKGLLLEKKALQQELQSARQATLQEGHEPISLPEGGSFLFYQTRGLNPQEMKGVVDRLKSQMTEGIIAVGQVDAEKTTLVLGVLGERFDAGVLLKELLSSYGARGGGRSDLAQGGWSGAPTLSSVIGVLKERLGCPT